MATTARGIEYPTTASQVTPLASVFATLASSADTAIGNAVTPVALGANHYTGTNSARTSFSGADLHEGITWYTTDTNLMWVYRDSAWKILGGGGRPILCRVTKSIAQNLASSQTITWTSSSPSLDTDGFYSTGATTRLTIPYDGIYRVSYTLNSNSDSSKVTANVYRNGSLYAVGRGVGAGSADAGASAHDYVIGSFSENDYLEVQVSVTGASGAWNSNSGACAFSAEFIGQT